MEKLLQLINEYENRDFYEWLEESEEEWIIEEPKVRKEYKGHLWFNGANTVQFPDDMFDHYACSYSYWFIKWLVYEWHLADWTLDTVLCRLVVEKEPVQELIKLLDF